MSEPTDHASPEHICNLAEDVLKLHKPDPDTPRTDDVQFQQRPISPTIENEMLRALSRKLERELAALRSEVERLKANLRRAIEIAEEMAGDNWPTEHSLYTELDQLKESINQDNK